MVFAEIGCAAGGYAVFENADAIDVETPDDWAAGRARRKAGSGNAGLGKQQIAKLPPPSRRISSFGTTVTVAN
jgi:hypothetical protein